MACVLMAARSLALEPIDPPFKLAWGEAPPRLERMLNGAKAKIVSKHPMEDGSEAWEVDGILQEGLKHTIFYFKAEGLSGVELQYRDDRWNEQQYDEFMGRWRRTLEQRYGPGELIARKTIPSLEVMQTIVGYKWSQSNSTIDLVFFSAKTNTDVFRTLSVHYRAN